MISLISGIYANLLMKQRKKLKAKKEADDWDRWEEYEDMRNDMHHKVSIEPIQKRKARSKNTRPKHIQ